MSEVLALPNAQERAWKRFTTFLSARANEGGFTLRVEDPPMRGGFLRGHYVLGQEHTGFVLLNPESIENPFGRAGLCLPDLLSAMGIPKNHPDVLEWLRVVAPEEYARCLPGE